MLKSNYTFSLIWVLLAMVSCKQNLDSKLGGTYQLIAEKLDFGPNANQEVAIVSKKTITLNPDGTIDSNGNLCAIIPDATNPSKGTYNIEKKTMSIVPCGPGLGANRFSHEGKELLLYFVCNGECLQRYKKIK